MIRYIGILISLVIIVVCGYAFFMSHTHGAVWYTWASWLSCIPVYSFIIYHLLTFYTKKKDEEEEEDFLIEVIE